jgi:hypothetical protein
MACADVAIAATGPVAAPKVTCDANAGIASTLDSTALRGFANGSIVIRLDLEEGGPASVSLTSCSGQTTFTHKLRLYSGWPEDSNSTEIARSGTRPCSGLFADLTDATLAYYVVVEPCTSSDPQVETRPPPGLVEVSLLCDRLLPSTVPQDLGSCYASFIACGDSEVSRHTCTYTYTYVQRRVVPELNPRSIHVSTPSSPLSPHP